MESSTKDKLITLFIGTLAVIVVIGAVSLYNFLFGKQSVKLAEYPEYAAIKGKNHDHKIKQIIITKDHINKKPATVDFDGVEKRFKVQGKFSRAYLYIEAEVDYEKPLTVWDDVYFKINDKGGHLIIDGNNLPMPPIDSSRYLYDLHSISYFPKINDKENWKNKKTNDNLFDLLQDGKKLYVITSISSDRPGRVMKEISIYYECFKGSKCSIAEIK
jgi:hypothetical protein